MRFARLAAIVVLCPPLLATCGEEARFFIVQNQVPSRECIVSTERSKAYIGEGRLDVSLVGAEQPFAYYLFPLLQNDLPRIGEPGAPEPNRLFIKGFRVSVGLGVGASAPAQQVFDALAADETARRFLDPWAATLEPGGGLLTVNVSAVPGEIARRLRQAKAFETNPIVNLMVTIKAIGERAVGDMESTPFRFPIQVCEDCLISFVGSCPIAARQYAGHACNIAQDDPIDCCVDGAVARCPAPVEEKTGTTP
jgi:hypothetical protein